MIRIKFLIQRVFARLWRIPSVMALVALALASVPGGPARSQTAATTGDARVALVVGVRSYRHLPELPNALRDAQQIADRLRELGFDVLHLADIESDPFDLMLSGFAQQASRATEVVFHFAGHGYQVDGENHLAFVDSHLPGGATRTYPLHRVISQISGPGRSAVVLLDATRIDPRPPVLRATLPTGLLPPQTGPDVFISLSARPGTMGNEGPGGGNNDFTLALLEQLDVVGQSISDTMIAVRNSVSDRTKGFQVPWDQSSLTAPFFFNPIRLTDRDFADIAALPVAQRALILDAWRRQGAVVSEDEIDRRLAAARGDGDGVTILNVSPDAAAASGPEGAGGQADGRGETALPAPAPENQRDTVSQQVPSATETARQTAAERQAAAAAAAAQAAAERAAAQEAALAAARAAAAERAAAQAAERAAQQAAAAERAAQQAAERAAAEPSGVPADLPRAVQRELARLGCYRLQIDGSWGRGSRAALAEFAQRTGRRGLGTAPTAAVFQVLRDTRGTVCTQTPPPAETPVATAPAPGAGQPPRGGTQTAPTPTPAPPQAASGFFGAIAFSRATYISPEGAARGWGQSFGRNSSGQAAGAAMQSCNNNDPIVTDCRVVLTISSGCGALAVGGAGIGTGTGASIAAAEAAALSACRGRSGNCRTVTSICARTRNSP